MRALLKLRWSFFAVLAFPAGANAADIHHYVLFNRDRERIADPTFLCAKLRLARVREAERPHIRSQTGIERDHPCGAIGSRLLRFRHPITGQKLLLGPYLGVRCAG
jgi:hypothetical protein